MANRYLQIEFKSGNLFEYSKEQKEGFEEHKNSKGNVSYRKYYKDGIYGVYKSTTIRDTDFGKEVSVHFVDVENSNNFINFPLFDQNKNIAAYAESLITVLPSMQENYVYRIFPYTMEKEGSKYKTYGISIKHADMYEKTVREDFPLERLTYSYTKKDGEVVKGDIPAVLWKDNFDGSKVRDQFDRNKYLHEILTKHSSESTKISNKVTGGEPPKPHAGSAQVQNDEVRTVDNSSVDNTIVYQQEEVKQVSTDQIQSNKIDLPF
jgi:hypothetical protein